MNGPYMHGELIILPDGGHAFIDGIKDACDHDYSDPVYQTLSGKFIYWHTYRKWAHLPSDARYELVMELHGRGGEKEDDPIRICTVQCTKCKKIYQPDFF